MDNKLKLKEIFSRYAEKEILNPGRMTCDIDPVADKLGNEVQKLGFLFGLHKKDTAETMVLRPENLVRAEYQEANGKFQLTGKYRIGNSK